MLDFNSRSALTDRINYLSGGLDMKNCGNADFKSIGMCGRVFLAGTVETGG